MSANTFKAIKVTTIIEAFVFDAPDWADLADSRVMAKKLSNSFEEGDPSNTEIVATYTAIDTHKVTHGVKVRLPDHTNTSIDFCDCRHRDVPCSAPECLGTELAPFSASDF